jgi:hypothetical protein
MREAATRKDKNVGRYPPPHPRGHFSLFAQRKVTKKKRARSLRRAKAARFPALLAKAGRCATRRAHTTRHGLDQCSRTSPGLAWMLGSLRRELKSKASFGRLPTISPGAKLDSGAKRRWSRSVQRTGVSPRDRASKALRWPLSAPGLRGTCASCTSLGCAIRG